MQNAECGMQNRDWPLTVPNFIVHSAFFTLHLIWVTAFEEVGDTLSNFLATAGVHIYRLRLLGTTSALLLNCCY